MKCETLDIWKRSCRLSSEIYKYFLELKDYGFKDQITRSSLSVPSNIAEGLEKDSKNEMKRFLGYSISSCAELITQIYIGMEISYIDKQIGFGWIKEVNEIMKMIKTFQKSI